MLNTFYYFCKFDLNIYKEVIKEIIFVYIQISKALLASM